MADRVDNSERNDYYGSGRQPWDDIVYHGWAVGFAAGNVLKYIRRHKGSDEADAKKARWYWDRLSEMGDRAVMAVSELNRELTPDECNRLIGAAGTCKHDFRSTGVGFTVKCTKCGEEGL